MSLLEKLKKNSKIKESNLVSLSKYFNKKDMIQTEIPMLNVALSGTFDGGFAPGITMWAGPSKHFKTGFALMMVKSYMEKYPDAVVLFYDSEFGTPIGYFNSFNIDTSKVLHTPLVNMEEFRFDIMSQLEQIGYNERVIIVVDSIGNLASKKEVEDTLNEKAVADMTRAKTLKSIFRMITPQLMKKNIPMVVVNHTYKTMEMYAKDVVSGGTGGVYGSDNIFILGRQQEKQGDVLAGYRFIINVEKSRYVKEKSKIPILITFDGGISKWSGLLDLAQLSGHVIKPKQGYYVGINKETGEFIGSEKGVKEKNTFVSEFWEPILSQQSFRDFVQQKYKLSEVSLLSDEDINSITDEVIGDDEEDGEEFGTFHFKSNEPLDDEGMSGIGLK